MRTRRGDAEVKRTKPGSSLDFRLEYENSKKWTDDDPRDGIGEEGELEDIFDELDVKRMIKKLEKAVKSYLDGAKGAEDKLRAMGKEMDRVLGEDRALTVVRHLKGSVENKKVKEALEIAKDVIGGKKAMDRFDRIAMKIAMKVAFRKPGSEFLKLNARSVARKLEREMTNYIERKTSAWFQDESDFREAMLTFLQEEFERQYDLDDENENKVIDFMEDLIYDYWMPKYGSSYVEGFEE